MEPRLDVSGLERHPRELAKRRFFDLPYVLLILSALFWSGNFIVARAVHLDVPPMGLVFWRWFGSLAVVLPFAWRPLQHDWPVIRRHWRIILALAAVGVASFNTLVYLGLQSTTALNAVLLQSAIPILIFIFAYVIFRDRVRPVQALGILLSLAGIMTIVARGDVATIHGLAFNRGDLLVFAAVVLWAVYSVLLRKRPAVHPLSFLTVTIVISVVLLLPLYSWEHLSGRVMHFDLVTMLAIGYVAIFPSVLAYLFYNRGVDLIGANRAGTFIHLMPLFGSIMAILFLGETFHVYHAVGIALILGGLTLAARLRA
jgi:drug/metabolite transporter (DMT)-like permease